MIYAKEIFTKERVNERLKKIKTSFRKAVDSRKSSGGRVVWNLYDECYELWSGSPAVKCLNHGLETESVITVTWIIRVNSQPTHYKELVIQTMKVES